MYLVTGVLMWWCVFQDEPHHSGRARARRTCSPASCSRARSGSSWRSSRADLRLLRRLRTTASGGSTRCRTSSSAGCSCHSSRRSSSSPSSRTGSSASSAEEERREGRRPASGRGVGSPPMRRLVVLGAASILASRSRRPVTATPGFRYGVAAGRDHGDVGSHMDAGTESRPRRDPRIRRRVDLRAVRRLAPSSQRNLDERSHGSVSPPAPRADTSYRYWFVQERRRAS
jgi:hypothetical protein